MQEISNCDLELTLGRLAASGEFDLDRMLAELHITDSETREVWTNRLRRELDDNPAYFSVPGSDRYLARSVFFRNSRFLIVPNEWELEAGILVVGHRLAPYCDFEVFPSEAVLRCEETERALDWKPLEAPLMELLGLHMLLGAEELLAYLSAEYASNREILRSGAARENAVVKINVLDMKEYYRRHEFEAGDALAVTIAGYEEGVFTFHYLDGGKRSEQARRDWCRRYEEAVLDVVARFGDALAIPDQLQQAFFFGGRELLTHDGGSLNEFYQSSRDLKIVFDRSEHSYLARRTELEEDDDGGAAAGSAIPEGFGISAGAVDSLEHMFRELGLTLSLAEVDSFIFDQLSLGVQDFDALCERMFGDGRLPFADEAQEAVFLNALEERLEVLNESYDRDGDEARVELRRQILELVEIRLQFLHELSGCDIPFEKLPEEAWRRLNESSIYLNHILDLLNAPGEGLDPEEAERLSEAVDDMAEIQEKALEELREALNL